MFFTDFSETLELDASFAETVAVLSSFHTGYLYLVSTTYHISKLQLAQASNVVNDGSRLGSLPLPVPLAGKMSASNLIHYFSSHPVAPDNTTFNVANKTNQSVSDFQTGTGAAVL